MTHTFQNQIEAIQKARRIIKIYYMGNDIQEFDAKLNDAGSTIAALNLSDPYKEIERLTNEIRRQEIILIAETERRKTAEKNLSAHQSAMIIARGQSNFAITEESFPPFTGEADESSPEKEAEYLKNLDELTKQIRESL